MTPRPPVPPKPPPKALSSMQHSDFASENLSSVFFSRYWNGLRGIGALQVLIVYYILIVLLLAAFWRPALDGPIPHPEILLKLAGAFCFLIGTLLIPLAARELFPSHGDTDPAFHTLPRNLLAIFDARLKSVVFASAITLAPVIPLFLVFNPLVGRGFDILDIIPFFIGVASAVWTFLLMELSSGKSAVGDRFVRRLSVIAGYILLHVGLVGLVARVARPFMQQANFLKVIVNLNPFSQFYILMEGPDQTMWLLFTTPWLRQSDYRLYLMTVVLIFLFIFILVYRAWLRQSDDET